MNILRYGRGQAAEGIDERAYWGAVLPDAVASYDAQVCPCCCFHCFSPCPCSHRFDDFFKVHASVLPSTTLSASALCARCLKYKMSLHQRSLCLFMTASGTALSRQRHRGTRCWGQEATGGGV